jgi:multisubunit Na+/H+ antiporter MnhG subunit
VSPGDIITWALLIAGVALEVIAVIGLVAMVDPFDRLHYVGVAGYGALLVGIAILVEQSFSLIGDKALATGVLIVALSPVLVHVTARMLGTRR